MIEMSQQQMSNNDIELIEWLNCKKELNEMGFTDDEINLALAQIGYSESDLTDVERFENEPYCKPFRLESDWYTADKELVEYRRGKEWRTTVKAKFRDYRIQGRYQGLKHELLVRQLFTAKYPWFNDFTWEIFQISGEAKNYEIYMKTEFGTLYVPIFALTKNNPSLITKRMESYWDSYRDGRKFTRENEHYRMNRCKKDDDTFETLSEYKARQQGYYDAEMKPLQSKEFVKLKEALQ